MAAQCGICREVVICYSLPCNREHRVCRQCLNRTTQTLGQSLKCPECRKVFGMIDIDLLWSDSETIPDKQRCVTCLEGEREEPGVTIQYCIDCPSRLCEEHFLAHQALFCGKRSHKIISFDEYRQSSDTLSTRNCQRHAGDEAILVCGGCKLLGCNKCQALGIDCPQGEDKHEFIALETKAVKAAENITSRSDEMKAAFMDCQDRRKKVLTDMEAFRENIVAHKEKLKNHYEQQARQLQEEYEVKVEALEEALQAKGREVERRREALLTQETTLQELQDGMTAILSSYHPARLVTGEDEILANIGARPVQADEPDFKPPSLLETDVSEENLLGLYLIFPIEHIETIEPPPGNYCYTVCFPTTDELIIHGGENYTSLDGVDDAAIYCIRTESNGDVKVVVQDRKAQSNYIIACQPLAHREGESQKYKEISRFQLPPLNWCLPRFVVLDDMIYLAGGSDHTIHFLNSNGDRVGELKHDSIKYPRGICTNGIEVFVGCKNSILGFKPDNPEETLRKICDVAGFKYGIPGICYHRRHIYVKPDLGTEIFIYNSVSGEKVGELKLPAGPHGTYDMQIHPDGRLALAGNREGAFCYRLNCN